MRVPRLTPSIFSFVLICLCLSGAESYVSADVKRAEGTGKVRVPPTPIAQPVAIKVVRGETATIVLDGLTSTTRAMTFIIRRQPSLGRLQGDPVVRDRTKAVIAYRADPASKGAVDTFTYSVKLEGSSSSEEAPVTINIIDPAPVLDVPGSMELGTLLAGVAVEKGFEIRNSGNASFRATVPLPEGWNWVSPAGGTFDIAPNSSATATVSVKAAKPGTIDEKIAFRGTAAVRFTGQVSAPMQAFPHPLPLTWNAARKKREGTLQVANNSLAPMTVRLTGPAELSFPAELSVPSHEKKAVTVTVTAPLAQSVAGTLKLETTGWSQEVTVNSEAAPPVVTVTGTDPPGTVDFGTLDVNGLQSASRTLTLRNEGGAGAVIRYAAPKYFDVSGLADESVLAPGQESTITIKPKFGETGSLKDDWKLGATGGDHELKLRAELDPEAMKKAMMAAPAVAPIPGTGGTNSGFQVNSEAERREIASLLSGGITVKYSNTDVTLPKVNKVRVIYLKPDRLSFEWQAPAEGNWTYRVLSMRLSKVPGFPFPVKDWGVTDNVKVVQNGPVGRAEVTGLPSGAVWMGRVVAVREDGIETLPGEMLTFYTPLPQVPRWPWILGGIVVVGLLGYWIRRKWRQDIKWQAS